MKPTTTCLDWFSDLQDELFLSDKASKVEWSRMYQILRKQKVLFSNNGKKVQVIFLFQSKHNNRRSSIWISAPVFGSRKRARTFDQYLFFRLQKGKTRNFLIQPLIFLILRFSSKSSSFSALPIELLIVFQHGRLIATLKL